MQADKILTLSLTTVRSCDRRSTNTMLPSREPIYKQQRQRSRSARVAMSERESNIELILTMATSSPVCAFHHTAHEVSNVCGSAAALLADALT